MEIYQDKGREGSWKSVTVYPIGFFVIGDSQQGHGRPGAFPREAEQPGVCTTSMGSKITWVSSTE